LSIADHRNIGTILSIKEVSLYPKLTPSIVSNPPIPPYVYKKQIINCNKRKRRKTWKVELILEK